MINSVKLFSDGSDVGKNEADLSWTKRKMIFAIMTTNLFIRFKKCRIPNLSGKDH